MHQDLNWIRLSENWLLNFGSSNQRLGFWTSRRTSLQRWYKSSVAGELFCRTSTPNVYVSIYLCIRSLFRLAIRSTNIQKQYGTSHFKFEIKWSYKCNSNNFKGIQSNSFINYLSSRQQDKFNQIWDGNLKLSSTTFGVQTEIPAVKTRARGSVSFMVSLGFT